MPGRTAFAVSQTREIASFVLSARKDTAKVFLNQPSNRGLLITCSRMLAAKQQRPGAGSDDNDERRHEECETHVSESNHWSSTKSERVIGMRIGLTGGVGSGKSSAAAVLRDLGAVVIDADALAREVVAKGTPGLAALVDHFGPDMLNSDGSLDRASLGALVFGNETERRALEAIVHPLVRARAAELEAAAPPGALVVHEIPLLVETGQAGNFDALIVVDVPVETQISRLINLRGLTEPEARARVSAQATRAERRAVATYVVENTGTIEDLRQRVTEVFEYLVASTR